MPPIVNPLLQKTLLLLLKFVSYDVVFVALVSFNVLVVVITVTVAMGIKCKK